MSTTLTRPAPAPHARAILLFIHRCCRRLARRQVHLPRAAANQNPSTATLLLLDVAIHAGLRLGQARTQLEHGARLATWFAIAFPFLIWQVVVWWITTSGGFDVGLGVVPALPIAIMLPPLGRLPLLPRSRRSLPGYQSVPGPLQLIVQNPPTT